LFIAKALNPIASFPHHPYRAASAISAGAVFRHGLCRQGCGAGDALACKLRDEMKMSVIKSHRGAAEAVTMACLKGESVQ